MNRLLLMMVLVLSLPALADKSNKETELLLVKSAQNLVEEIGQKNPKMGEFLQTLLKEKRYEVFASLEVNRLVHRYVSARYVFGSVPPGLENSKQKEIIEKDVEKQKKELTFEHYKKEDLEKMVALSSYLQMKIEEELKRREK